MKTPIRFTQEEMREMAEWRKEAQENAPHIKITKQFIEELRVIIEKLQTQLYTDVAERDTRYSEEREFAKIKLQEAVLWLGIDLRLLGETDY